MTDSLMQQAKKQTSALPKTSLILSVIGLVVLFFVMPTFNLSMWFLLGDYPTCSPNEALVVLICIFSIAPILAIVFGAIAIVKINRSIILKGKNLAIAGIIIGTVVICLWVLYGIFWFNPYW